MAADNQKFVKNSQELNVLILYTVPKFMPQKCINEQK